MNVVWWSDLRFYKKTQKARPYLKIRILSSTALAFLDTIKYGTVAGLTFLKS